MDLSILTIWMSLFEIQGISGEYLHFYCILQANNVEPAQGPRFEASELDLHCSNMSLKRVF